MRFFGERKLVFFAEEAPKEKGPAAAVVPETETVQSRKLQARTEVDQIYGQGKYDTYNFRNLPPDFKAHLRSDFEQWIDGQIVAYDKDKNSGIDAAEYQEFKAKLNEKVEEILDRLIELKREKQAEAKVDKASAEQAAEMQKKLEGVDVTKLDASKLGTPQGIYFELIKYQKDFENEANQFGTMTGLLGGVREKVDHANKSHYTGATGLGEYLVSLAPWAEDIPEVKYAKAAKEKAVADFETKLAAMKKRQKDRQQRGDVLNGAPEKIKSDMTDEYVKEKQKLKEQHAALVAEKQANDKKKREREIALREAEEARAKMQKQYDELVAKLRIAYARRQEVQRRNEEMRQAQQGLEAGQRAAQAQQTAAGEGADISAQTEKAKAKTIEAQKGLQTGMGMADAEIGRMQQTSTSLGTQLVRLDRTRKDDESYIEKLVRENEMIATSEIAVVAAMDKLEKDQNEKIEQVASMDEAVATTVLEVDVSNFEIIKQGDQYLKMLRSMEARGPGFLDMLGSAFKGIPGVEAGSNWVGAKLGAAWEWTKKAPVIGDAIQIVGYMGEGWVKAWDGIGSGLSWVGDKLHLQEAWDWMSKASHYLGNGHPTGNAAFDTILTWAGGAGGTVIEVFAGVTEGCKDLVKGLGMMVQNPIATIQGLGQLVNHPGMLIDALIQRDKWSEEGAAKIIGRMMVDVVTTLTGAGATATAVKTSIAAAKIGGMSVGRAAMLGGRTFVEVFVRDVKGVVVGVVKLPATLVRGIGQLTVRIAGGGKAVVRSGEAMAGSAKAAATVEEAYHAVEATRGKPDLFKAMVREHPEYLDLHAEYARNIARAEAKAAKSSPKKSPEEPALSTPPERKTQETNAHPVETGITPDAEAAMAKKAERERKPRKREDTEFLAQRPQFEARTRTPERAKMVAALEEAVIGSPKLRAVVHKLTPDQFLRFADALPTPELRLLTENLDVLDSTMIQKILKQQYGLTIDSAGRRIRYYLGETLGEGAFGVVSDCAYITEDGSRFVLAAAKRARNVEAMKFEVEAILQMLREKKLTPKETGKVRNQINALKKKLKSEEVSPEERISITAEIEKLERRLKENKMSRETEAAYREEMAALNRQINEVVETFAAEMAPLEIVRTIEDPAGILRVHSISGRGLDHIIIFDRVKPGPGRKVELRDRMLADEPPENILGYAIESIHGLDTLHENGLVHWDYAWRQVLVGEEGGVSRAVLGDLAVSTVEDVAEAAQVKITEASVSGRNVSSSRATMERSKSSSRGVSGTPGYFSPEHAKKLLLYIKRASEDARAKGLDPSKIDIPKEILEYAERNQVGVSLQKYSEHLAKNRARLMQTWNMSPEAYNYLLEEIDGLVKQLKDPDSNMAFALVIQRLEMVRQALRHRDVKIKYKSSKEGRFNAAA